LPQIINGTFTPSANTLDDVYVAIQTPSQTAAATSATTNAGATGVASWGPFSLPQYCSTTSALQATFGPPLNTGYDLVPEGAFFLKQQPLGAFVGVRVGDGTQAYAVGALVGGAGLGATTYPITTVTNYSSTITTGGTSQSLMSLNANRTGYTITNTSTGLLYFNPTGAAATIGGSSIGILPGQTYVATGTISTTAITIIGAVTAQSYTATEFTTSNAAAGVLAQAYYQGSLGNSIQVGIQQGSLSSAGAPTWRVTVQCQAYPAEVFDNIVGSSSTALTTWTNIANAINNGLSSARPKSQWITLQVGTATANQPVPGNYITLSGGSDGVANITTAVLVGQDGTIGSRTGIYCFEQLGLKVFWVAGLTDVNAAGLLDALAISEHSLALFSLPASLSITPNAAISAKIAANINDAWIGVTLGQHVFYDTYLAANRAINQCAGFAGLIASLDPSESPGNKPFIGLVGTDITVANGTMYGRADMANLENAGILFTSNIVSAKVLGARHGRNSSSNTAIREIAYTTKINDIALAVEAILAQYVDQRQTLKTNDPVRSAVLTSLNGLFGPQKSNNLISDFFFQCDLNNNSAQTIGQGLLRVDGQVRFVAIVNVLLINVLGGQTVQVSVTPLTV